jgi:hypothetical protein
MDYTLDAFFVDHNPILKIKKNLKNRKGLDMIFAVASNTTNKEIT